MRSAKPRILIGPVTCDPTESVGLVNEAIMGGLADRMVFVPHIAKRTKGASRQGNFNLVNLWYFAKHFCVWIYCLIRSRPLVAHYGITSDWNLEKSLLLLRIARWFGVATVGHLHGGSFLTFWGKLPSWRRRFAYAELKRLKAFVVLSEKWKKDVEAVIGLPESVVFVVNNPIDGKFESNALEMPVLRESNDILCFGVMDRKKGVLDILRAAEMIPTDCRAKFLLVGPEREVGVIAEVKSIIAARGIADRVSLVGPSFGEAKLNLFRNSAILLLPSYAENFPLCILEAAAAGLPIIATPVGATPEFFVSGQSAQLIPVGDAEAIAENVVFFLLDGEARGAYGRAARTVFIERLCRDRIMESMAAVYRHVLDLPQNRSDIATEPARNHQFER